MKMRPRKRALETNDMVDNQGGEDCKSVLFEHSKDLKPFEDATLLYRTVAARFRCYPIFLYRNLTYFMGRMTRSRKCAKNFDFDTFFKERPRVQPKEQKYMTITYLGFLTQSPAFKNPTIRMETLISKIRGGRKRMKNKTSVRVSAGVCEVYINPEMNDSRQVPIISIPPDMLNLDSSTQMMAKSLIIRAITDGNPDEGFECRQILLNENGSCPMAAGDYEMSAITAPPNWVKAPLQGAAIEDIKPGRTTIHFNLEWTPDSRSGWVPRPPSLYNKHSFAKDAKGANKENRFVSARRSAHINDRQNTLSCSLAANEHEERKVLEYSFHTSEAHLIPSFLNSDFYWCPWCELNCMSFFGLFKHLKVNHERFLFNFSKTEERVLIDVKVNDKADLSNAGDPTREIFKKEGPRRLSRFTEIMVWKPRRTRPNLDRFLERQWLPDESQRYIAGHNRMYFHSSTCLPIHPSEMDEDSENERDPKWLRQKTEMMIDDFTDVNEGEKEVIKMWNLFVLKKGYVADCQRPKSNKDFYMDHAEALIEKNLYRSGFLHLVNQYHFNLLGAAHAARIYRPVTEALRMNPAEMKRFREKYVKEHSEWLASGGEGGSRDKAKMEFQTATNNLASSTFVTGEGTLRRKLNQQPNAKPTSSSKPNVRGKISTSEYFKQLYNDKFQIVNNEKDRACRKRKFSHEDSPSMHPTRRLRGGSDPVESRKATTKPTDREKPVMRKTAD